MNQLCKVCGEPAAGYHFGAFTCEGCKSFFGRTYNNLAALGECKNNGQCVINKKNRTSCKSCRLKKCLMVGMSKSDQAEMSNRLAEQGVIASNGQLTHAFSENKDLLTQYKKESFRETNSVSGHRDGHRDAHRDGHRVSPRDASPRAQSPHSSDGSADRTLSSPYSAIFEARYGSTSPAFGDRKEVSNHFALHGSALPLSPVSPLSPLNAASRFFFHNSSASALFGKGVNGMPKLYNGDLNYAAYQCRFLPMHALNPVLKASAKETDNGHNTECYADVPEQDRPIDLSLKRDSGLTPGVGHCKPSVTSNGDHDSGFSPSSNEENHHTSPLDLTSKPTPEPPLD